MTEPKGLSHLKALESESIEIFREVAASFERPVMMYSMGMALAMPSITLIALDLFPKNRGLTSSLQAFEHSFVAAVVAGVISPLLSASALTLALGMAVLGFMGWSSWMVYLAYVRRGAGLVRA